MVDILTGKISGPLLVHGDWMYSEELWYFPEASIDEIEVYSSPGSPAILEIRGLSITLGPPGPENWEERIRKIWASGQIPEVHWLGVSAWPKDEFKGKELTGIEIQRDLPELCYTIYKQENSIDRELNPEDYNIYELLKKEL